MEELLEKETQATKTQKKEAPLALKVIITSGWAFLVIIIAFVSTYKGTPPTSAELATTQATQKANFISFEQNLYSIPKQCDADFSTAQKSLKSNKHGDAKTNFQNAHSSCLAAYNEVQKVKVPSNLNDTQTKTLKSAIEDITTAYASKNGASNSVISYLSTGETKKINKAKDEIKLSETNLLNGMLKVKQVKNELNISAK